ncbi:MAG: CDP-2,3-bis-(O-geranylgeranyl)-sn-glycerol synthase [Candidatus Bathyarchaeota archaeon]|nr:CDP-2,3-bis-(O-geranylgeranyl)-sn-glycerol synthase [Candidatus Bathyarchaeota archaeon]MDH5494414.1 CDP-2,3-bis-(O-geranylgeranyl)-sn-glycerol synthase [Candidatus Bathyarchaeota archaeon]
MSLELVAESLIYIFPAYSANAVPAILGGGQPLDFGKNFKDTRPIFGSHKTFRGFFAGLLVGTLVGVGESFVFNNYNPLLGFVLSLGAVMGDLAGAFVKRRLGFAPGALFPIVDQVGFVLCALLFSLPIEPPTIAEALIILVVTIPIHLLTNFLAYLVRLKKKPW